MTLGRAIAAMRVTIAAELSDAEAKILSRRSEANERLKALDECETKMSAWIDMDLDQLRAFLAKL